MRITLVARYRAQGSCWVRAATTAHRDSCHVPWSLASDIPQVPAKEVFVAVPCRRPTIPDGRIAPLENSAGAHALMCRNGGEKLSSPNGGNEMGPKTNSPCWLKSATTWPLSAVTADVQVPFQ